MKGKRRLGNFVISTSPADFAELLPSTGPPLPDLQRLHSPMAKVEWKIRIDDLNTFLADSGRPPLPFASIERQLTVDRPVEGVELTIDRPVEGVELTIEPLASRTMETVKIRQGPRPWSRHLPHRRPQQ